MIYFDNASTSPLSEAVKNAIAEGLETYGNPSSLHQIGRQTKALIESTRRQIAKDLNCLPAEVFFTSGATESLNTSIRAAVANSKSKKLYCSDLEHYAVLDTLDNLVEENQVERIAIPNDHNGVLSTDFLSVIGPDDTVVMMAHNNEIGNRNPIEKIASASQEIGFTFICDVVQTIAYESIDLKELEGIQSLAISSHKFNGPKGIGILFWRNPKPLKPLLFGGSQERGLRPGTENILGIIGLGTAWKDLQEERGNRKARVLDLRNNLKDKLLSISGLVLNGINSEDSHPGILNVSVPYSDRTSVLLFQLDLLGLCVSEGSACTSGSSQGSHVIKAMNKNREGRANIRLSFSHLNTIEEVEESVKILQSALEN